MDDQRSTPLLGTIEALVAEQCLPGAEVRCSLVRSYTNDVYRAESDDRQVIVKVYGAAWRSDGELRYEIDLLEHLAGKGIAVARAIPGNDGAWLHQLTTAEGRRQVLVFEVAPGSKPVRPFTTALYRTIGQAAARMHAALADFESPHPRFRHDTEYLIDRPLSALRPYLANHPEEWSFLVDVAAQTKDGILAFARDGLDWGVIHGDLTLDNLHVTEAGGIVFYDFDDGAPGWRAQEFQGVYRAQVEQASGVWDAYLDGYLAVRELSAIDLSAIPTFALADHVCGMGVDADRHLPGLTAEQVDARIARWFTRLRRLVAGS